MSSDLTEREIREAKRSSLKRTIVVPVALNKNEQEAIDRRNKEIFKGSLPRSTFIRTMALKGKL